MKKIVLGKLWKRVLARLIDTVILLGASCLLFFTAVYPNTFDESSYYNNLTQTGMIYDESGLFVKSSSGTYVSKNSFSSISTKDELTKAEVYVDNEKFTINLTGSLYSFYTEKVINFGSKYNFSFDVFKSEILKVGDANSNIKDFKIIDDNFVYELIDEKDEYTTVSFVIDCFSTATGLVDSSSRITELSQKNNKIMQNTLIWLIPIVICFSVIFDLLIPLFSKNNESIGKYIFKLGIISKDGYKLKKYFIITRWLSYLIIEVFLGVLTFLGTVLISYTMMMFNKKKRVIHDYFANSIVIDKTQSIWFDSPEEERYLMEHCSVKEYL